MSDDKEIDNRPFTPEQWDALVTVIRANILNSEGKIFDVDLFKEARSKLVKGL